MMLLSHACIAWERQPVTGPWSVQTGRIQSEARACQAQVVASEDFANQIANALQQAPVNKAEEKKLSDAEVEEWLKLFKHRK
jgi:hypothetical protein